MRDAVFLFGLIMLLWGGGVSLMILGSGTTELALEKEINYRRNHGGILMKIYGSILWCLFDSFNRWLISVLGLFVLLVLKLR